MERFPSRKDAWLSLIIWATGLALLVLGILPWVQNKMPTPGNLIYLAIMWGTAWFVLWMWHTVHYVLTEDHLLIRFGPFRVTIPYSSIRMVRRTVNHQASLAQSSRRIEIRYRSFDLVYISPAEEERFLSRLRERCPQASFEG
mgnify:FL=1